MAADRIIDSAEPSRDAPAAESAPGQPPAAGSRLEDFAFALFGHVAPEDLVRYEPRELADLAASAWAFISLRKPGVPKIRVVSPAPSSGRELDSISVIEIVNDDMPFLVDSVMAELNERRLEVQFVAHPVLGVARDGEGRLTEFAARAPEGMPRESLIHVHVARIENDALVGEIVTALESVLKDVRGAVADWKAMVGRVEQVIADLKSRPPPIPADEVTEAAQFLGWLIANNFTFLGVRDYTLSADETSYDPMKDSGLGVLRSEEARVLRRWTSSGITPDILAYLKQPCALVITKSSMRSRVHRRVHMDYVGVKRFAPDGRLVGEFRIVGLFTSTAYTHAARTIPYLRRLIVRVIARSTYSPDSHSGKVLANIVETYPRDELFQIDDDTLFEFVHEILFLGERPRVRVLPRHDRFGRFVSLLVFIPRERYDVAIQNRLSQHLATAYGGHISAFYPYYTDGPLVRVHYIIGRGDADLPHLRQAELEVRVGEIVRSWTDELIDALNVMHDPSRARALRRRYLHAFSSAYREAYSVDTAIADIHTIEHLSPQHPLAVNFHRHPDDEEGAAALKIWSYDRPIPLSERVPVLENMGFRVVDEHTYHVAMAGEGAPDYWLHDMMIERASGGAVDLDQRKSQLESLFIVVMSGGAENDGYNALTLATGLGWRDVALVRAISRYQRQIRIPFSQDYMWATLVKHAGIAEKIVRLFHARLNPHAPERHNRGHAEEQLVGEIEAALQQVASLDEDRILRRFVNAVQSALRTNYYQLAPDGQPHAEIAIKYDSHAIDGIPLPAPRFEIFVYSPRVEGIHLRFGKVARGGIRWSDRRQDFRTEVLGLVKAQQVKNAVIVPVGAKGGFVPKRLPPATNREAFQAEGVAAYRIFISRLLDITDNLGPDGVIPPADVTRYDDDDPYLVVAADKGTATFSDIANALAQERGYWLDDAFASGGSAGYDHKKMGITARGAWESVKRHFREMNVDISQIPFSVVGVGDMSGDVFGNGMLREHTTRLVAAFDHRDIFIDPDPDPEKSFVERQRLFDLPRSSWQDYDKSLISAGGGVFPRTLKEIALSNEAQAALGFAKAKATPQEVISAILKAPVDLLYFGGIGTYVRASDETDEQADDRANDAVRVTGNDLRCKVIAEGANLGMTQRGRIEAAQHGVRLNTDAIDNSAGVNTSDIEVNIKIALSIPMRDGRLSRSARDSFLADMTDEVAPLVLHNNYQQTLALSLAQRRSVQEFGFQQRLMQTLEARGHLDRAVEFLPDDMVLDERRRAMQPLTRPELAVLLSYAKLELHDDLLESAVPDDPFLSTELTRYFPQSLARRFPDAIEHHRLRREIIATQLANAMINRGGPTLIARISDQTGAATDRIAAAFTAVRKSYDLLALNDDIDALDNKVAGDVQLGLYAALQDLLIHRIVWFLRHVDFGGGLAAVVEHYHTGIADIAAALDHVLPQELLDARRGRVEDMVSKGVPDDLALRIADLAPLTSAPDVVLVADRSSKPVEDVAATYFAAGVFFRLHSVAAAAREISVTDYFDRLALDRSLNAVEDALRRLAADMTGDLSGAEAVAAWVKPRSHDVERIRMAVHEIAASGLTLSKLAVAASMLGDLARG